MHLYISRNRSRFIEGIMEGTVHNVYIPQNTTFCFVIFCAFIANLGPFSDCTIFLWNFVWQKSELYIFLFFSHFKAPELAVQELKRCVKVSNLKEKYFFVTTSHPCSYILVHVKTKKLELKRCSYTVKFFKKLNFTPLPHSCVACMEDLCLSRVAKY